MSLFFPAKKSQSKSSQPTGSQPSVGKHETESPSEGVHSNRPQSWSPSALRNVLPQRLKKTLHDEVEREEVASLIDKAAGANDDLNEFEAGRAIRAIKKGKLGLDPGERKDVIDLLSRGPNGSEK